MKKPAAWREVSGLVWLAAAGCLAFGTPGALAFDARGGPLIHAPGAARFSPGYRASIRSRRAPNATADQPGQILNLTEGGIAGSHVGFDLPVDAF